MPPLGVASLGVALAWAAWSQQAEPPVLQYTGKPIQVSFQCTDEDIQWAGLSCTEEDPCPLYFELAAVESVGNRVFLAGNIHSATVTLYSILLASDDAGQSWRETYERMRGVSLDHIQFVDFENGWVSGQLLVPLPQDPFFLISSDAGKTWRRRPVFGENRFATIHQFWFSSRTNGSLVIDRGSPGDGGRYELLESPNGGETWMIRQVNERPIKLNRTANANPDWRINANAASKAFRVERRIGEKWSTVSAFAVPIEACKPPPREEIKPPDEPAPAAPSPEPAPAVAPKRPAPPTLKRPR